MPSVPAAELLTPVDSVVYKSVRTHEDRLDSSPLELQFRLSGPFLARVLALYQAHYDDQVGHHDADHALQTAFQELVSCEILYYNDEVPMVYVEHDPNSESKDGVLTPITPPELRFLLDESTKSLTVAVERRFPLSSAHGGRPFRLAFVFDASVLKTRKFCVMAKKGKAGTERKRMRPQKICPLSARRRRELELIKAGSTAAAPAPEPSTSRRKRARADSIGSSVRSHRSHAPAAVPLALPSGFGDGEAKDDAPWVAPTLSRAALGAPDHLHAGSVASSGGSSVDSGVSSPSSFRTPPCEPALPVVFPPAPPAPFARADFADSPVPRAKPVMPTTGPAAATEAPMSWETIMDGEPVASPEELRDLLDFGAAECGLDLGAPAHDDFGVVLPLGLDGPTADLF